MEENIYIIEQYIAGELEGKALEDFNEKLQNDPNFAADVKISQALHKHVSKENVDFLDAVKEVDEAYHAEPKTKAPTTPQPITRVRFMRRLLAAAASILLLIALGWLWLNYGSITSEKIYAKHFEVHSSKMGSGEENLLVVGSEKLRDGKNQQALNDFDQVVKNSKDNGEIEGKAKIYQALAYLKMGEIDACKDKLKEIDDAYIDEIKDKAKEILNDVNKL